MARYFISTVGDVTELPPVSLPPVSLPNTDEIEAAERAKEFSEKRLVKDGQQAWDSITTANTFANWTKIGKALLIGKTHALRITGANRAAGKNYSHEFHRWMEQHGFQRMRKSDRSHAVELAENIEAIEAWRLTLPEKRRHRLKSAQAVTKAWRKDTETARESPVPRLFQLVWEAEISLRRFLSSIEALPQCQAAQFRQRAAQCVASIESPPPSSPSASS